MAIPSGGYDPASPTDTRPVLADGRGGADPRRLAPAPEVGLIPYGKDKNCPDAAEIRAIWAAQAERHSAAGRRRETVQLYQDGVPVREIARCLGFAGTAGVYDALRSAGVPPNRGGRAPQPREKVDPVVTFVRYLAELGRTETQIMTALGVPRVRVAAILRDMQKGPAA